MRYFSRRNLRVVGLVAALSGLAAPCRAEKPRLEGCLTSVVDKVKIAAQQDGLVAVVEAREGMHFDEGSLLGKLDDSQVQAQRQVVVAQQQQAAEKAANTVDVRYAEAAAKVAEFEHQAALEANAKAPGAISQTEVNRLALARDKAVLSIEQAKHTRQLAAMDVKVKDAELAVVDADLARRRIVAPFDGEVTEAFVQRGQWVRAGEPLFEMIRMDKLRVEGFGKAALYAPEELLGRPVVAQFNLERGRKAELAGKIVFTHPEVDADGQYRVVAELANVRQDGRWLLRPGTTVTMVVDLEVPAKGR